jgi:homoserine O-succinyltransferase
VTAIAPPVWSRGRQPRDHGDRSIVIGLVNNMPDAALRSTERQFRGLLAAAADDVTVCLRLFFLPELPRSQAGRAHMDRHYDSIDRLWASRVDGLIVTGTEPRAPALTDEPYWRTLTKLVDWAEDHTISAVWSCLAAHAAVLHRDGIARRALGDKLVGVFECVKVADHAIVFDAPPRWRMPHSRLNELPEDILVANGYRVLSRSAAAGADMFAARRNSLFLFFQGHPEYDLDALFREYRRDVSRYLANQRNNYPEMPCDYFDEETKTAFLAFKERALHSRDIDLLASFPGMTEEKMQHAWRGTAVRIYANWLSYLVEQRSQNRCPAKATVLHENV